MTKLVSITPNAEAQILYVARVSSNQERTETGLINFLIRNNHWSPFMHAFATIEFVTSRRISAQMIRHWTMGCLDEGDIPAVQEFSQRYAEVERTVKYRGRMRGTTNRQSSLDTATTEDQEWYEQAQIDIEHYTLGRYREALRRGFSYESAANLLPIAAETKIYLSGSLRSWIHYLKERCAENTQHEHRILALEARDLLALNLPVIAEALNWETG